MKHDTFSLNSPYFNTMKSCLNFSRVKINSEPSCAAYLRVALTMVFKIQDFFLLKTEHTKSFRPITIKTTTIK